MMIPVTKIIFTYIILNDLRNRLFVVALKKLHGYRDPRSVTSVAWSARRQCDPRNMDYGYPERAFFKSRTFGLGQKFWLTFFEAFGYFRLDYQHPFFGTVSSMFSIIQLLFLQKTKPLYPTPKYLFGTFGSGF